jgi:hypothetical protein
MFIEPEKNRWFFSIELRFMKSNLWIFENHWSRTLIPDTCPPVPIGEDLRSPGGSEGEREAMGTSLLWSRTVKVVLVHSYGPQNNDKVKEPANEVAVLPRKPSARQGC